MKSLLKKYFGYDEFRPLQAEAIKSVLEKKDTFVLMPTGSGKSLCYQLPALELPGITLVISPLIALMKDQVDALKANGIKAAFINSSLKSFEIDEIKQEVKNKNIKLLYIAPERLALASFQQFLKTLEVSLIAIDEAHCISEWGHDFRPDYRNLKSFKSQFPKVPIIALTATATPQVQTDILHQLHLKNPQVFVSSFDRPNLNLQVTRKKKAFDKLLEILKKYRNESAIIYCFSRKDTEMIADDLKHEGFSALPYHAGLENNLRQKAQELFIKDEVKIIVATIAFGMGIDKPDIRLVVHYTFPKTLEGYYQEIGRAGRDGLPAECVLFYSYGDKRKHDFFIEQIEDIKEKENAQKKLNQVIDYCELFTCRRQYLLQYFGEKHENHEKKCGACDACNNQGATFDATEISQKILSCVFRTGNRFGAKYIVDVLKGAKNPKISTNRHDKLSVFGIVSDFGVEELKHIVQMLRTLGYLQKSEGQYPTLSLTQKSAQFLKSPKPILLPKLQKKFDIYTPKEQRDYDVQLFEKLRILRKEIADSRDVPPFVIFSDVSLRAMAHYLPCNLENFSRIEGVGSRKLEDFGEIFSQFINIYVQENKLTPLEVPDPRKRKRNRLRQSLKRGNSRYQTTREMVVQKKPLNEIAKVQGLTESTIINHIDRLVDAGEELDIDYLKPPSGQLAEIKKAFLKCGSEKLKPVYDFLDEKYSYEEIRLASLFLR